MGYLTLLRTLFASMSENMWTGKEVERAERGCNNMDHMDKKKLFLLHPLSKQYWDF